MILFLFIHGFMGSESSFSTFPFDLKKELMTLFSNTNLTSSLEFRILPAFESKGSHIQVIQSVHDYVLNHVVGRFEQVFLCAHSMGGLLIVDALRKLVSHCTHLPEFTLISFDSPFWGLHPNFMAHAVQSQLLMDKAPSLIMNDIVKSTTSLFSPSSSKENASAVQGIEGSQGTSELNLETLSPGFQCMSSVSASSNTNKNFSDIEYVQDLQPFEPQLTGNSQDISLSDPSYESKMQVVTDWTTIAQLGVASAAVAGGLYFFSGGILAKLAWNTAQSLAVSYGVSKAHQIREHAQFLYPIWGETQKEKAERMEFVEKSLQDNAFCFYIHLIRSIEDTNAPDSFVSVPTPIPESIRLYPMDSDFDNVVLAHMNMFSRHDNPGHYWLLIDRVAAIIRKRIIIITSWGPCYATGLTNWQVRYVVPSLIINTQTNIAVHIFAE